MKQDQQAFLTLRREVGPEAPVALLVTLTSFALLLSKYGKLRGQETHNWLGEREASAPDVPYSKRPWVTFPSLEQGVHHFLEKMYHTFDPRLLTSGDIGQLAWALLTSGLLPVEDPTTEDWEEVCEGLTVALDRVHKSLEIENFWQQGRFRPPASDHEAWSHRQAHDVLDRMVPEEMTTQERIGLLAWAFTVSNYGFVNGVQTHNWALLGRRGDREEEGYVLDETGTYLVKIFASNEEGIQAFLDHVDQEAAIRSFDCSKMAEAMIRKRAMGVHMELNRETWIQLTSDIRRDTNDIARENGWTNRWKSEHVPAEVVEQQKEESQKLDKQGDKPRYLRWGLGIAGVLAAGFTVHKIVKSNSKTTEEDGDKGVIQRQPDV